LNQNTPDMKWPLKISLIALMFFAYVATAQTPYLDSLRSAARNQKDTTLIQTLNELYYEFKNSNLDSSMLYAQKMESLAGGLKKKKNHAFGLSYGAIANVYEAMGKMDSSEIYHFKALKFRRLAGDSVAVADTHNNLGILYDLLDRNTKSLHHYMQALKLYEAYSKRDLDKAKVYSNMGIVFKKLKEYQQALTYYKQALAIYEKENIAFGVMILRGNIGSILLNLKKYEESLDYTIKAKADYEKAGYLRYLPYMLHNMAIAQDSLGRYVEAEENYKESIRLNASFENWIETASAENALANLYVKQKKYQQGKALALQARAHAREVKSVEFEARAIQTLAKAEMGLGNFQTASKLLLEYIVAKDSLFEEQKTKQIFQLTAEYETEKKEQQIELQNAQLSEQALQLRLNQILLIFGGFAILLLIIVGILYRGRVQKKQKIFMQQQELRTREAEIQASISSQEKERARYARDLHDGFGQMISALNLNLKSLEGNRDKKERDSIFTKSTGILKEMYDELKNICFDMMPQTLIHQGLAAALREFADRINGSGKVFVEVNIFGLEARLTELQEISIYRIAQEWVNNVLKYSDAKKITVQVTRDNEEITLLIEDDGMGFDKTLLSSAHGNGWKNMSTRANLLQGDIDLDTQPGTKGSTLILNVPFQEKIATRPRETPVASQG
jgi:signal transduction histidine kinase